MSCKVLDSTARLAGLPLRKKPAALLQRLLVVLPKNSIKDGAKRSGGAAGPTTKQRI